MTDRLGPSPDTPWVDNTNPYTWATRDYFVAPTESGCIVHKGNACYQVRNKTTGVIEFESLQLGYAILNAHVLQVVLDDIRTGAAFRQDFQTEIPPDIRKLFN